MCCQQKKSLSSAEDGMAVQDGHTSHVNEEHGPKFPKLDGRLGRPNWLACVARARHADETLMRKGRRRRPYALIETLH